jgi:hypothetical protein
MPVMKFKDFEDLDRLEREGKGVTWQFKPDRAYLRKVLRFHVRVPHPSGLYRFKTFGEADKWEMDWWIRDGASKTAH